MPPKRQIGEKWSKTTKGVTYLLEKQPDGKIKPIKRISPYINKDCANSRSSIEATKGKPARPPKHSKDGNWRQDIKPNRDIKPSEPFDPLKHRMVRIDNRTFKQVAIS